MTRGLVLLCVLIASPAWAQRPIGLYDPGPSPPAWASFGTIADVDSDAQWRDALALSRSRGFSWILQLGYHEPPTVDITAHARRVRARLEAAGLRPYVVAYALGEEWYEYWRAGVFARHGFPPSVPNGADILHAWLGAQQGRASAVLGLPALWVTTAVNENRALFPWQPVPAHTGLVAVDAYVPTGGTFAAHVAPILAYAETQTALPLVLIPQWFEDAWRAPVTAALIDDYAAWARRSRWIATLGFTWRSRPTAGIAGLADLPAARSAVARGAGAWGR